MLYALFCMSLTLVAIALMCRSAFIMIQVIRRKKDDSVLGSAIQSIFSCLVLLAISGYLMKNPPIDFHTVILTAKLVGTLFIVLTLHELGHFVAAKLLKVPITEFSVGAGPTLYKRKRKNILYQFKLLPIKGHVAPEPEVVSTLPLHSKCFLYLAGIFVNLICFIVGLGMVFIQNGEEFINGLISAVIKIPEIFQSFYLVLLNLNVTDIVTPQHDLENTVGVTLSLTTFVEQFWVGFAILSLMLAVLNTIPIPILDGGQVVTAFLTSFLKLVKTPKKLISVIITSLFIAGYGIYYGPFVINNIWSSSLKVGMNFWEYVLWLALAMSIVMNFLVYYEKKYPTPIDK